MPEPRCIRAEVVVGKSMFDDTYVKCGMEDGSEMRMYFYPDEISFRESELVGLTDQEIHNLKGTKDRAFLRS